MELALTVCESHVCGVGPYSVRESCVWSWPLQYVRVVCVELALTVCESHVCGCYCKPVCITLVPLVQSQSFKDFLKEVFQIVYYYKGWSLIREWEILARFKFDI